MDSINGPDAIGWRCARCGHAVPIDNREVHEARCGRASTPVPPPPPMLPPAPASPSPFDPDEETPTHNVFTPDSPPRAAQTPQRPPQQPSVAAPAPSRTGWREVNLAAVLAAATATGEQREQEQRTNPDRRRRLQALQERSGQMGGQRPFTSSSSSSSSPSSSSSGSGYVFVGPDDPAAPGGASREGAGAGAGAGASAAAGTRAGGRGESETTTWACNACTFLNNFDVSRCGMCGTRMSPQQRPPDRTYRDTLISDHHDDAPTGRGGARRRRQAGAAGDFEAAAEEARCRLLAEASARRGEDGMRGGGSGGRGEGRSGNQDDDGLIDTGGAVSGAAAGSFLGALSAGMLSAMQPGARPGRVLTSALQGALMGGAAGAALGGITDDTGARGGNNRTERGSGGGRDDFNSWTETRLTETRLQLERERQRQLSLAFGEHPRTGVTLGGGRGGEGRELDLLVDVEELLLARRMEMLNLPDAAAEMRREAMRETVEGPRGILRRRRRTHLHEQEEDDDVATRPASARAIAALPSETLTAGSLSHLREDGRQCCICLEDFGAGDEVKRLQCLHLYHTVCIDNWLRTSGTCPQCKHRVDLA
eukprot:g9192.t1